MTKQDPNDKDRTEFKCKICSNKGKFNEGAYACPFCKYYAHQECGSFKLMA